MSSLSAASDRSGKYLLVKFRSDDGTEHVVALSAALAHAYRHVVRPAAETAGAMCVVPPQPNISQEDWQATNKQLLVTAHIEPFAGGVVIQGATTAGKGVNFSLSPPCATLLWRHANEYARQFPEKQGSPDGN